MSNNLRTLAFFGAAIGLHAVALFGMRYGAPVFVSDVDAGPHATEVALVETATEEPASEPPAPEPEPAQPEPPPPEPTTPTPPSDVIPDPMPELAEPESPKPRPKPFTQKSTATAQLRPAQAASFGSPNGTPGASPGKPGAGDNSHATWRNRIKPPYPEAARSARLIGSVQIQITVNALGQPTSARVVRRSGSPLLDETALRAARTSSFNPKRLAGIPLPDTLIVPYTFRRDGR